MVTLPKDYVIASNPRSGSEAISSYHWGLLHCLGLGTVSKNTRPAALRNDVYKMGREGVEPSRCHHRRILSPLRLPIPPSPRQMFDPCILLRFHTVNNA